MIIGVTGKMGAGKDTFAVYLGKKGFIHISLSDIIRQEAAARGIEPSCRNLQDLGNVLRREYGNGVLSKMAQKRIIPGKNYVVTSIRNVGEIEVLIQNKEFVLIAIDAPQTIRFARITARNYQTKTLPLSFEDFQKLEERELISPESSDQRLDKCAALAKTVLLNDVELASFHRQIDILLESLGRRV